MRRHEMWRQANSSDAYTKITFASVTIVVRSLSVSNLNTCLAHHCHKDFYPIGWAERRPTTKDHCICSSYKTLRQTEHPLEVNMVVDNQILQPSFPIPHFPCPHHVFCLPFMSNTPAVPYSLTRPVHELTCLSDHLFGVAEVIEDEGK